MSLKEFLQSRKDVYPFHMPGHKRNPAFLPELSYVDVTEVYGADNLHQPQGIIKELQQRLAKVFGAEESFILVNGSTCGIEAAIMSVCSEDCGLLMARNAHRSAYGGLILSGARPCFVAPEIIGYGIAGGVRPEAIEEMLNKTADKIGAVYLTSPTYEGVCSDIEAISKIVHAKAKLLIVDEAHGAHFGFHKAFPESAVCLGADIVVQSLHKTLPVPSQCSVLHVNGNRVNRELLRKTLGILQTSSPSYFFMAAIENCVDLLERSSKELFDEYYGRLCRFIDELDKSARVIKLARPGNSDIGKLVFHTGGAMSGRELMDRLRTEHRVELEMCGLDYALAMTGIADTDEGFARLLKAMLDIDKTFRGPVGCAEENRELGYLAWNPEQRYTPREAFRCNKRRVMLSDSEGCAAADFIIPYPPGVPAVAPGEIITRQLIDALDKMNENGIYIMGADEKAGIWVTE